MNRTLNIPLFSEKCSSFSSSHSSSPSSSTDSPRDMADRASFRMDLQVLYTDIRYPYLRYHEEMLGVGHGRLSTARGTWAMVNNTLFFWHPHSLWALSLLPCEQGCATRASAIPLWSINLLAGLEQFQLGPIGSQAVGALLQGRQQVVTVSSDAGGTTHWSVAFPTCTSQGDGARTGFRTSELWIITQSRPDKGPQNRAWGEDGSSSKGSFWTEVLNIFISDPSSQLKYVTGSSSGFKNAFNFNSEFAVSLASSFCSHFMILFS